MRVRKERVQELIRERGFRSQADLGRALQIDRRVVSGILNDQRGMSLKLLERFCKTLDCTPNDILEVG